MIIYSLLTGVVPVTVHDALYLSENDLNYVLQYEDIEQLFWHFINLKYYPEQQIFFKEPIKKHKNIQKINKKEAVIKPTKGEIKQFNFNEILFDFAKKKMKESVNSDFEFRIKALC